jgi:hypothetical protein
MSREKAVSSPQRRQGLLAAKAMECAALSGLPAVPEA